MAVHLATGSDYLQRTTALLPTSGSRTWCVWTKQGTIPTAGGYNTAALSINLTPATYTKWGGIYQTDFPVDELSLQIDTTVATSHASASANVWVFHAWTQSGTSQKYYRNGALIGTVTQDLSHLTSTYDLLGGDSFGTGDYSLAYCRQWTAALTQSQIQTEMFSDVAVLTAGNYMDCSFDSDLLDASGNGHGWTQVGSGSFVAGPVFPSNNSPATATAFGTLPQTITQDFGLGLEAWYSYTGHSGEVIAGFWAYATIPTDAMDLTVYESDGVTPFLSIGARNKPVQVPQSEATLLYFKVKIFGGTPPSTDVTISAVPGPTTAVPAGSIFVNDDTPGITVTGAVAPTDGANYQVLQFFPMAVTASENGGDVLETGEILIGSDDDNTYRLYSGQLEFVQTVAGIAETSGGVVRTCVGAQVFYVAEPGSGATHATVYRVDATGTVTDNWTLSAAGATGIAASNDESIVYVAGQSSSVNSPIKQWNTNTSSFDSDLAGGVATYTTGDLLVLGDDSICGIYQHSTDLFVRRYDAAGSTLNTYSFVTSETQHSLFHAIDDPNSFWLRAHNIVATGICSFYNIKASDGSILSTVHQASYEGGAYVPTASASPLARFGLSESCPAFILRIAISPTPTPPGPGTGTDYIIRRERWWPHISHEEKRQTFGKLQIILYAGNGLTAGPVDAPVQGEDPIMEVDWSDDGGHTWSNIHFIHTGRIGAYKTRAIIRRMGQSRDRVYRIAVSDPNQWAVISADLDATLGTS